MLPPRIERLRTNAGGWLHVRIDRAPHSIGRVVLLHGGGGSSASWDEAFISMLVQQHLEVLRLDLPDAGRSDGRPEHAPRYRLRELARCVEDVLQELEWSQVIMMGVALGAAVGEALARSRPGLCEVLVLVSPLQANRDGDARLRAMPQPAAILQRTGFGHAGAAPREMCVDYLVRHAAALAGPATDPAAAVRVAAAVYDHADNLVLQLTRLPGVDTSEPLQAPPPHCPTLVVHGTADPVLTVLDVSNWAAQLPSAQLLLLADAGHADLPRATWPVLMQSIRLQARAKP